MGPSGKLLGSDFSHACHALDSFEVQCERWSVCVHGEVGTRCQAVEWGCEAH